MKRTKLKNKSDKQIIIDREVTKLKSELPNFCILCGSPGIQAAHLLPRSTYPEYYSERWNIVPLCKCCHTLFDDNVQFRTKQVKLYNIVKQHDECAAHRHFRIYE